MLRSRQKPFEEILGYLEGEEKVFILGCRGCAEGCESGGEKEVSDIKARLEGAGKVVTGTALCDMVCNPSLTRFTLKIHENEVNEASSVLVMTCGVGVQTVAQVLEEKVVHPGCDTISSGGAHAEWKEGERCFECGDCVLEYTGGICPIARCSKHLLNGPCGGSSGGKCEVSPDVPCAWYEIVERLRKQGRLEKLLEIIPPKKWKDSLIAGIPRKPGIPSRQCV